ncbi:hypothetical protein J6590_024627 [Homalodisca vitripennis]|nr:hypothetical protein J6590_024627 [Homalodisca vitripennis]
MVKQLEKNNLQVWWEGTVRLDSSRRHASTTPTGSKLTSYLLTAPEDTTLLLPQPEDTPLLLPQVVSNEYLKRQRTQLYYPQVVTNELSVDSARGHASTTPTGS